MRFGVASPYPLRKDILCKYVAYLAEEGLQHKSIKVYLAGIHKKGFGQPLCKWGDARLEYVMACIKALGCSNLNYMAGKCVRLK